MSGFSVKRPYLVLVCVLALLILGATSFVKMQTDFLPNMNLPYMAVITGYPGASPQKVEEEVTIPVENSIAVINGVKRVQSTSSENAGTVFLEFENGTDMDSAMVKISSALDQLDLPENAMKPYVLEVSMDMLPVMYLGVACEGKSGSELSQYIEDEIVPVIKRQDGVASVQTSGMIVDSVEISLSGKKADALNDKIKKEALDQLSSAESQLSSAEGAISSGKSQLASQKKQLQKKQDSTSKKMAKYTELMNKALATEQAYEADYNSILIYEKALNAEKAGYQSLVDALAPAVESGMADEETMGKYEAAKTRIADIDKDLTSLATRKAASKAAKDEVSKQVKKATKNYQKVESGKLSAAAAFGSGAAQIAQAESQLASSSAELASSRAEFEANKEKVLGTANADKLLSMDTLSALISAQNFSMPAGYVEDNDTKYLLKIDEETEDVDEIKNMVIVHLDGIGDVRVKDVASVKIVNNEGDTYAKLNGNNAAIMGVFKTSTKGTSTVSNTVNEALEELEKSNKGLKFTPLMDQGMYINFIVKEVLSNLLWGALLAMIVLALFLRRIRPTLIVALSIPLSVMFALLLMYFSDITLNVISLSGLGLSVGMLVDNSIVVMENIYRMRSEGVGAVKAAIEGAKEMSAPIISSTLTTICVFVPILFTNGLTRELVMDMCLTVVFSLTASLIVALSVVPTLASTILQNVQPADDRLLDKVKEKYEVLLRACLAHKAVPILVALVLLAGCAVKAMDTGIIIMPEMESTQMSMTVEMDPESTKAEDFETMDRISEKVRKIKGVTTVGAIQTQTIGMDDSDKSYTAMVLLEEDYAAQNSKIVKKVEKIIDKEDVEDFSVEGASMDTSQILGSGLQVDIYGNKDETLLDISKDIMKMAEDLKGFEEISNGQEEASKELVLDIDKDKAMREGLSVAQIYQVISEKLTTEKDATSIEIDGNTIDVKLVDKRHKVTRKNLLSYEFETTVAGQNGEEETKTFVLRDFADVTERDGLASITHLDSAKAMQVTAQTKEGYNTKRLSDKLERQLDKYDMPAGYRAEITGETESVNKVMRDMLLMILISVALIYLIMVAQFRSFLSPFIVMFTIPLAYTGGFIALFISRSEISLLSMMGFLMLSGIVVNNGIVFIDYINRLRLRGMDRTEAIVEAGKTRMRPILMTALTTILAMTVMAAARGEGAALGRGMAIVMIGGLVYATLMTLIVVPVIYDIFVKKEIREVVVEE